MEFLDFSEYSDPPLLTSVTTHRALDRNRGENDMVSGMEKYCGCIRMVLRRSLGDPLSKCMSLPQMCSSFAFAFVVEDSTL